MRLFVQSTWTIVALLAMVVLGWGYWHMVTHATLNLSLNDVSLKTDRQAYGRVVNADIVFMDGTGGVLSEGRIREPYGVLSFSHPEIGDCSQYERDASSNADARQSWQHCFEAMSRWLTTWVRNVRYATVTMKDCRIEKLPVLWRSIKKLGGFGGYPCLTLVGSHTDITTSP